MKNLGWWLIVAGLLALLVRAASAGPIEDIAATRAAVDRIEAAVGALECPDLTCGETVCPDPCPGECPDVPDCPEPPGGSEPDPRIAALAAQADAWRSQFWPEQVRVSRESAGNVRDLYQLEYAISGYTDLGEATGDRRWLGYALDLARNAAATYPWRRVAQGDRWMLEDLKATVGWGRLCRLAGDCGDLVAFLDGQVLHHHLIDTGFGGFPTGLDWLLAVHDLPPAGFNGVWNDHQSLAARLLHDLCALGVERWCEPAEALLGAFAGEVTVAPDGAALYDVGTYPSPSGYRDVWHGNREPRMLIEAGGPRWMLHAFARTFTARIWKGDALASYIDGSVNAERPSQVFEGYCHLGAIDPDVLAACTEILSRVAAGEGGDLAKFHTHPTLGQRQIALVGAVAVSVARSTR